MDFTILATVFGVIFVSELPDKTVLASLILGTRYRPGHVFVGVAAAFAVHVLLAVAAGSLLGLLPHRAMEVVVAVLFAVGAVLMLRRRAEEDSASDHHPPEQSTEDERTPVPGTVDTRAGLATRVRPTITAGPGFARVAARSFLVLFVAEFGDLTQIVTANLAAQYHAPVTVGIGSVLGLWAVGALAIIGGRQLLRFVPFHWITRTAAVVMAVLATLSMISAALG